MVSGSWSTTVVEFMKVSGSMTSVKARVLNASTTATHSSVPTSMASPMEREFINGRTVNRMMVSGGLA